MFFVSILLTRCYSFNSVGMVGMYSCQALATRNFSSTDQIPDPKGMG